MGNLGRRSDYYKANEAYLQGQLGNPKGEISRTRNTTIRAYGCVPVRLRDRSSGKSIPGTERDRRSVSLPFCLSQGPLCGSFFRQKKNA